MNLAIKILWPDPAPINSEASTTLAFYLPIGVFIAGQQGPQGEQGPPGSDADTTALREELLGTGGGSTVFNGTYDGSTLHYTGGEIVQGSGAFGGIIDQAGVHSIELVVPDFQGSAQIMYSVNDTPSSLANANPEILFYGSFGLNQSTHLPTFMAVVFPDSGVDPQFISRDVAVGDIISLTISNNNSTLTVTLNGTEIWSATTTQVLTETYTHLMFSKTVESDTIPDIQVSGLAAAAGTPGLIDTLIHDQVDPVVTAQLFIYQRLSAVESVNTAQDIAIAAIELTPGPQGPAGPQGEQGPQGDPADPAVTDDLQAQIDAIYDAGGGNAALQNATYENGVLHYTGGTVPTPIGDRNGCSLTVPADTQITLGYQPDTLTAGQSLVYLWHTSADAATALTDYLSNGYPGLSIIAQPNGFYVRVDGLSSGSLADPGPSVINLAGRRLQIDVPGVPNASYETPETAGPAPAYLHIFSSADVGSAVADAAFDLSPAPSVATGLLPDETAARIAADAALQDQIDDVQTLAEINQLSILEKADQVDLDTLQTTVTGQGITLAQKANQTALDALTTVVSGKATPADITAAIAALVDGAPDALNTLSELATALAGEQAQIADLLSALALRVRVDAIQSLTTAQQLQARQNINAEAVGVAAGLVAAITPASIGAATAVQGAKADTALQSGDVAPVALSGQYSDLAGLPTIHGLSSSTPAAPTTTGTAGTATTSARGDHAHPLPTASQITAAVLTGLATGSATAIAAADSILQALAKLQAQASANASGVAANAALLAPVPRKIGPSWYVSGRWYDPCHPFSLSTATATVPAGAVQFVPMCPVDTLTAQQIGIYVSTAAAAGSKIRLGVYADNSGIPGARLYESGDIASDSTGNKTAPCTQTFTAGVRYWLALYSGASAVVYALLGTAIGQMYLAGSSTIYALSGQSGLPATGGAAVFTGAHNPRIMLQAG